MLLGETFRLAREEKGQTISQVAEATRMMVQIIEDLERDDFRRIAAPIYGRGFIKLYAEHLGLDPEPLIREFMEIYTGLRPPQVARRGVELPPDGGDVGQSNGLAVEPSDPSTVPFPDKSATQPSGEPDLFSMAAGRSEAVCSVPDPAAPGETAPPRVRPVAPRPEMRAAAPLEGAPRREPAKLRPEGSADMPRGGSTYWPSHWTPAIIGAIAAVILLVLVVGLIVLSCKAGKTHRAKPAAIKVERVLLPSAPYFD